MRIVLIGPFGLSPKNTMRVRAIPLAQALVHKGHQVKMIMPPWHTREPASEWHENGVDFAYVAVSRIPVIGYLVTAHRLVHQALSYHPDVVHCFKPKAYAGLAELLIWQRKKLGWRVRLVVDEDDWEGAGGWNDREPYPWLQKRFFSWQERWGLRHCDALTAASRTLQSLAWSMGISPHKVTYLPNGASELPLPASSLRAELGLAECPVVLCYTRFVEFSPERLADIWRLVLPQMPNARLLVVGRALDEAVEARFEKLFGVEFQDSVRHTGWIPIADLPGYLASADVAVFPCDDNLINRCKCSVKLTDLLTAGLPVVADAVGQNCEYIVNHESGWLVEPGDNAAMANAIVALLRDAEQRKLLGERARHRMLTAFSWPRLADDALSAYTGSSSP